MVQNVQPPSHLGGDGAQNLSDVCVCKSLVSISILCLRIIPAALQKSPIHFRFLNWNHHVLGYFNLVESHLYYSNTREQWQNIQWDVCTGVHLKRNISLSYWLSDSSNINPSDSQVKIPSCQSHTLFKTSNQPKQYSILCTPTHASELLYCSKG